MQTKTIELTTSEFISLPENIKDRAIETRHLSEGLWELILPW
jgi:hypothetical protein